MKITYHGPDPNVGPKCDVCFIGKAAWHHPITPFAITGLDGQPMVFGVEGAVAACDECSHDLEAGESRMPEMETRAIEGMGELGQVHFKRLKAFLHKLHHGMVANRCGARRPA